MELFTSFDWNITTASFFLVLLVITSLVYYTQSLRGLPPFPTFPLPIIGNLLSLDTNPKNQLKQWRKKHGDIYSLYFGQTLVIVLNGYDVIKEALVKNGDKLSDRPAVFYDVASDTVNIGISGSSGPPWKEEREATIHILRDFGMGKNIMAERIDNELSFFLDVLKDIDGKPTDLKQILSHSTSNVIMSFLIGKRFDYSDKNFNRLTALFHQNFSTLSAGALINFFPKLMYLPGDLFMGKKVQSNILEIMGMLDHYIQVTADSGSDSTENFIASYLKKMERKVSSGQHTYMSERSLKKCITDIFAAGFETTTVTLMWWILYMIHYPQVQSKAFEEIKREIGLDRPPRISDKGNMRYVTAMIMETQRLCSVVPLNVMHCCSEEFKFHGFTIPKGANIAPNLDSVLLAEDVWGEDVNILRPERFLDQDGGILCPDEFVPFSIGKRFCPGESLAKMELFLFITNILQRFQIVADNPEALPDLEGDFGLTYVPRCFKVCMVTR